MSTQPHPTPEITQEQLQMALRHLWRPGWPPTLDAVLAHPTYGKCLRGLARNLGRAATRRAQFAAAAAANTAALPSPPSPTPTACAHPGAGATRRTPRFDARKAAANDIDD